MRRYVILIERPEVEGDNFSAYCPDLPGCVATGDSEAEVVDHMAEAIELHLAGLVEDGEPLPESTVRALELAIREPEALATGAGP